MQVDFSMPGRLDAQYIASDDSRQTPVMLHRAILGSFERFVGILIEEHEAKFPLWLAPVHAVILNITDKQAEYAKIVQKSLTLRGFKVELDLRNEKVGYKIREHIIQRVPYMLVIGDRELETNTVAVRTRSGEDLGAMSIDDISKRFSLEIARHGHAVLEE
jgi:threonyl-tRNA synthetase